MLLELAAGLGLGVLLGWVGVQVLRRVALPASGLYPLATMVWIVFTYGVTAELHTSGFAAVYACALILGNAQLPHRGATRWFVEGTGWIAQIGLFVMLGLLAVPERLNLREVLIALGAGLFLTLIARPASVFLSATVFRMPLKEQLFLSWAGLRGAVPIIMATVPLSIGGAERGVPVRRGAHLRHHLHLPAGTYPAVPGPQAGTGRSGAGPRGRGLGRAAGQDLRRHAAGAGTGRVPDRRGGIGELPPSPRHRGHPGDPRPDPVRPHRAGAAEGR